MKKAHNDLATTQKKGNKHREVGREGWDGFR